MASPAITPALRKMVPRNAEEVDAGSTAPTCAAAMALGASRPFCFRQRPSSERQCISASGLRSSSAFVSGAAVRQDTRIRRACPNTASPGAFALLPACMSRGGRCYLCAITATGGRRSGPISALSTPSGSGAPYIYLYLYLHLYPPRIRGLEKKGQGLFVDLLGERA
jgi:hypothetical protein